MSKFNLVSKSPVLKVGSNKSIYNNERYIRNNEVLPNEKLIIIFNTLANFTIKGEAIVDLISAMKINRVPCIAEALKTYDDYLSKKDLSRKEEVMDLVIDDYYASSSFVFEYDIVNKDVMLKTTYKELFAVLATVYDAKIIITLIDNMQDLIRESKW